MGNSLSVLWVHYGCYFAGVVRSFDARAGTHHVVYDDGDEEDIVLRAADVVWGGGGNGSGGSRSAGGGGGVAGGRSGGGGVAAAGSIVWQERKYTSQYRGVSWKRAYRRWQVYFVHDHVKVYLGYFDDEEDAARAHDRMAVWFELHGIVRYKFGGRSMHDLSSVKASLNFAYGESEGGFAKVRLMTQEECVQSLRQQGLAKRNRTRPESVAETQLALGGDGGSVGGGSAGGKRKRVRSESAVNKRAALVGDGDRGGVGDSSGGGGGGGGGGSGGGGGGGSGNIGVIRVDAQHAVAAVTARLAVAEARADAADAKRHHAEMQVNAGLTCQCLPLPSP